MNEENATEAAKVERVSLAGMTWDHARGRDGLVASNRVLRQSLGAEVAWTARSLLAFGDQHIADFASDFDLLIIDHPHVAEAVERGALLPLDALVAATDIERLAGQSAGRSHESYHYAGHQWAFAVDAAAQVTAFRPDRVDDVPVLWQDVLDEARRGGVLWPYKAVDAFSTYATLVAQLGTPLAAEPGAVPPAVSEQALSLMIELSRLVPSWCQDADPIDVAEALVSGDDRMAVALFGYSNYSHSGFRNRKLQWADIPSFDGRASGSLLGGAGVAVSAFSRHPETAARVAALLSSYPLQADPYAMAGGQPGNVLAWKDPWVNDATDNFYRNTLRTIERASVRPRVGGWPHYQLALSRVVRECVLSGRVGPGVLRELEDLADLHWTAVVNEKENA